MAGAPQNNPIDTLIAQLKAAGRVDLAERLDDAGNSTAYTSSSEMCGEIGVELRKIKGALKPAEFAQVREALGACQKIVGKAWRHR